MKVQSFNEEEFKTLLTEAVLVAGGAAGIATGNIAQTAGAMMLSAAASPILYGGLVAARIAKQRWFD